jgi:hypothetical protein
MNTCETCKHRDNKPSYSHPKFFLCTRLYDDEDFAIPVDDYPDNPRIVISPNFGCILWEPKP